MRRSAVTIAALLLLLIAAPAAAQDRAFVGDGRTATASNAMTAGTWRAEWTTDCSFSASLENAEAAIPIALGTSGSGGNDIIIEREGDYTVFVTSTCPWRLTLDRIGDAKPAIVHFVVGDTMTITRGGLPSMAIVVTGVEIGDRDGQRLIQFDLEYMAVGDGGRFGPEQWQVFVGDLLARETTPTVDGLGSGTLPASMRTTGRLAFVAQASDGDVITLAYLNDEGGILGDVQVPCCASVP